jgi:hypothetical protein
MLMRVLHCPKCRTSQEVDFDTIPFRFINRPQTGSMREIQCPKCGFFIPGRNALNAASMRDAIKRQKRFEERTMTRPHQPNSSERHARTKAACLALVGFLLLGCCLWFYFLDKRPPVSQAEIDLYGVFFRPAMFLTLPFISGGCLWTALRIVTRVKNKRRDTDERSSA